MRNGSIYDVKDVLVGTYEELPNKEYYVLVWGKQTYMSADALLEFANENDLYLVPNHN